MASCASSKVPATRRSRARRSANWSLRACKTLDDVAYVRFASVYRDFREVGDFHALIDELSHSDAEQSADTAQDAETAPGGR